MNRDARLDAMRVIAIALVTLFHIWRFIGSPTYPVGPFDLAAPLQKGAMGVTVFVFLSGFLCKFRTDSESAIEFIKRKLLRIIPAYYSALVIWNLLLSIGITEKRHGLWDNISHLLFVHNLTQETFYSISGVFWYIGLQIQLYLIFALLSRTILSSPSIALFVSVLLCFCVNILAPESLSVLNRSVLSFAFPFILGITLSNKKASLMHKLRNWPTFFLLGIITIGVSLLPSILPLGRLDSILNGLLVALACISLPDGRHLAGIQHVCGRLAMASYSIYLYNYVFYCFSPTSFGLPGLLLYTGIVFLFGVGAYFLIEWPLNDLIAKKFANRGGKFGRL